MTSRHLGEGQRPQPTLVTTGTGSGKTESFLYPILDHVVRHRRQGGSGVSGLILYPMNALATDQAQRLARMITEDPQLGGIRAAIYTGDDGDTKRSRVSSEGLINDREAIQSNPPDILLTNYKMLDQMLLRVADQKIWSESALSLRYLVLDEFHTYDGAQGTDVAMLLRRLGLKLKSQWPDTHPAITDDDRARPLGLMTPVATSATLGDRNDPTSILTFAHTVFGEEFTEDAVVTESRYSVEEWAALPGATLDGARAKLEPIDNIRTIDHTAALQWIEGEAQTSDRTAALRSLATIFSLDEHSDDGGSPDPAVGWESIGACLGDDTAQILTLLKAHPWVKSVFAATTSAKALDDLAEEALGSRSTVAQSYLSHIVAGLSLIRAEQRLLAPTVDVHLWVRALTRIDRIAGGETEFSWSDDGHLITAETSAWDDNSARESFPAIYCRNCGRNGWGIIKSAVGDQLAAPDADKDIRRESVAGKSRFRALISAGGEADRFELSGGDPDELHENLAAFNARDRDFITPKRVYGTPTIPDDLAEALRAGDILPVLVFQGPDAEEKSKGEYCPACGDRDSIRFLGSAVATLLSVSLSTLFGDQNLDDHEKKSLVFTDSVQDAAHRAGFVESRSHVLTLRNVIAEAVGDVSTLEAVAGQIISQAGEDSGRRYRALPPEFSTDRFTDVRTWWEQPQKTNRKAAEKVMKRLSFDAALEFGLQSRYGRTLSTTGTVYAEVVLPEVDEIGAIATEVLEEAGAQSGLLDIDVNEGAASTDKRVAWVRAVVERLRTQGAIHHSWLDAYVASGGERIWIWGKRKRDQGMPAFPTGRSAPAFAVTGLSRKSIRGRSGPLFDMVESNQGWYARYAARTFGITANHGAGLTKLLLQRLAAAGILRAVPVKESEAVAYGLEPLRIRLERAFDGAEEQSKNLECTVCGTTFPAATRTLDDLNGAQCLLVGCAGTLKVGTVARNFYRDLYTSAQMTRIVAREHSSVLGTEERKAYEDGFKRGSDDPSAPNVLVATPTLEMGIDIGDLSTVMLGSLPETVASYVQRVGRAGRLTGNALNLAVVGSTSTELRTIHDPLSLINGSVQPPATYLDAVEIIKRQYLAFLMDRLAQAPGAVPTRGVGDVFGAELGQSEFLNAVIDLNDASHEELLAEFFTGFGDLIDQAKTELTEWATVGDDGTSGLKTAVWKAHQAYRYEVETLQHQLAEINLSLNELQAAAAHEATATEDDKDAYRQAVSAHKATDGRLKNERRRYWIEALETYQLLPNYTLLDDTTQLDVSLRWRNEETQSYENERIEFERGAKQALRDFAPGSTFYGRSLATQIDAVELGPNQRETYELRFCAACGYSHDRRTGTIPPAQCPRCGDASIADVGQRLKAVQLRKVSAMVNRDEARISDADDERRHKSFTIAPTADIDPASVSSRWFVDGFGFGVSYLDSVTVTTTNFGPRGQGQEILASGETIVNSGFVVCDHCGKLDSSTNGNQPTDHRPWCPKRNDHEESNLSLVLTHQLTTQGALMRLPESLLVGEHNGLTTLQAAIRLGLAKHLGGDPDHIDIIPAKEPLEAGGVVDALLLHDIVPGGTGYLADLRDPETMWKVLYEAWRHLSECECKDANQWACAKCLLPYVPRSSASTVSRAIAAQKLAELLQAGRNDVTLSGEAASDASHRWTVTEEAPQAQDPESYLERRFRQVFRARLERANINVQDKPAPTGTVLSIHRSGSRVGWSLTPQVPMGNTKPDFLLTCDVTNIPDIAIYTDGRAFHASSAVNRLADDAQKRSGLRGQGLFVIAITNADVESASADKHGADPGSAVCLPEWYSRQVVSTVLNRPEFGWTNQAEEALGNPIDVLIGLIQAVTSSEPDLPKSMLAAGDGAPLFFAMQTHSRRVVMVPAVGELAEAAVSDITGQSSLIDHPEGVSPEGYRRGFLVRRSAVTVLIAPVGSSLTRFDTAVILDDRPEAMADSGQFASSWREWLHISNVMPIRSPGTFVQSATVMSVLADIGQVSEAPVNSGEVQGGTAGRVDVVPVLDGGIPVSSEWTEILSEPDLSPQEAEFANDLVASGLESVPEWGFETDEGISLDFAWPQEKIAVLVEPDDEDSVELERNGWTLASADVDSVRTALGEWKPDESTTSSEGDNDAGYGDGKGTHE
ncbi:DEAD/DEAH box helicase [Brevibacterium spongiae]|uniref:DEAD/DEAH box helicase n=1 Tax=Brevibacterium spongiae TaxID=2909672 RepID=UPI0032119B00